MRLPFLFYVDSILDMWYITCMNEITKEKRLFLSKSKYCLLWQCPKMLWLYKYRPERAELSADVQKRFAEGSEAGEIAKGLFGDFTDVSERNADGSPNIAAMIENTQKHIALGTRVICEAAFDFDGLYCAVDLLRKTADGYTIYEVKSSVHAKRVHAVDVAYQKYVLEHCGINVTGTYIVTINADYVFDGKIEPYKLFKTKDISEQADAELADIEGLLKVAENTLCSADEPACDIGAQCFSPYECAFKSYCFSHIPEPSVFDIYRMSQDRKFELYRAGLFELDKLLASEERLSEKQRMQIDHALNDRGTYVDKPGVRAFLQKLSYPLYFLDFETMQLAVPRFAGTKPYECIPFQYSLHCLRSERGELCHKEFLAESGEDPRPRIAERLCADIPADACVLAYNKMFEHSVLYSLADEFPELAEHLRAIADNLVDLIEPFRTFGCYNRAMGGSFSIKSVLPAMFPDDPDLNYKNLNGVHNGTEAMDIFPRIKNMPEAEQAAARASLLKYCALDTFAMVKLLQKLIELSE